jgi:hypothetical protein
MPMSLYKVVARCFVSDEKLPLGPFDRSAANQLQEPKVEISIDRIGPIQGLLRLYSRYGPPDRSAAQSKPLSQGSSPAGHPAKPLVSFRINRQLSGWNLPPLMIRAFEAHSQAQTLKAAAFGRRWNFPVLICSNSKT